MDTHLRSFSKSWTRYLYNIGFPIIVSGFMLFTLADEKPWGIPYIGVTAVLSLLLMYNLLSLRKMPLIERQRFAASFCFAAVFGFFTLLAGKQLEDASYAVYSLILAGAMSTMLYRAPRDSGYDRIFSLIASAIIVSIGTLLWPEFLWLAITIAALVSVWAYLVEQNLAQRRIDMD